MAPNHPSVILRRVRERSLARSRLEYCGNCQTEGFCGLYCCGLLSISGHTVQEVPEPFRVKKDDVDEEAFGNWKKYADIVQDDKPYGDQYAVEDIHYQPPLLFQDYSRRAPSISHPSMRGLLSQLHNNPRRKNNGKPGATKDPERPLPLIAKKLLRDSDHPVPTQPNMQDYETEKNDR